MKMLTHDYNISDLDRTLVRMMFALVTTSQDFSQSFHIKSYNLSSQLSYLTVAYVFP